MKRPAPPKRIINLLTLEQIEALIDGIEQSAFTITTAEGDGVIFILSVGEKAAFTVNLTKETITRPRGSGEELVFTCTPGHFFLKSAEQKLFLRLEAAISMQYSIGGQAAVSRNMITRREVVVLIDAIRAMAFKIEKTGIDLLILYFDGREVFRIETTDRYITLVGLSNSAEIVYSFTDEPESWFWAGTDRKLWKELTDALAFYELTMHKVRMADYRAMFGNQMQKVITGLAQAMDEAEAEVRMLEKVDKTNSGANLHPDVARLVQKDLDAGEAAAQENNP